MSLKSKQLLAIKLMANPEAKLSQEQIAMKIGVHPVTISRWKQDMEFRKALLEEIKNAATPLLPEAYKAMYQLLNHKNPQIQFLAAKDLLDRCGLRSPKKENVKSNNIIITQGKTLKEILEGRTSHTYSKINIM